MPEDAEYLTIKQAAHLVGYRSLDTLYGAVRLGRLRTVKPEGSVLLTTRAWLDAYHSRVHESQRKRAQRHGPPAGEGGE